MSTEGSGASLNIRERSDLTPGCKVIEVDCSHATTTLTCLPGLTALPEGVLVRVALLKHHDEEGCACTTELRRRYGLVAA